MIPSTSLVLVLRSQMPADIVSLIVTSFTTLLYLAMALIPLWWDSGTKPSDGELHESVDERGKQ